MSDDIVARLRADCAKLEAAYGQNMREIDRLRTELAVSKGGLDAAVKDTLKYRGENETLRALLREAREELDELAETNDVMMLKRKKLREILRAIVASIDAALKGGWDE